MKTFRRLIFVLALLVTAVSVALLVTNYDPSNPTNRRYSSEVVKTTGDSNEIGLSGERVLSKDLGLPRNDLETPRLAVCNTNPKNLPKDTECIYYSDEIENYRVPDFVSSDIIAESKNAKRLLTSYERDYQQIQEIAMASKALNRPLWLYVRNNTLVDTEYREVVESTGGRIVYYFATDGYVNPIDFNLFRILAGALGVMVVVLLWEMLAGFFAFIQRNTPKPKSSVAIPVHKTLRNAQNAVDDYERFVRHAGDNARNTLDK